MKKSDRITAVVLLAAIALVLGAWLVVHRTRGTVAVIRVNGAVVATVDLKQREPQTLHLQGMLGPMVIVADGKGSIRVTESTCPDQICVHTAPARSPGDQIICVPNRMVLTIEGAGGKVDAVAH